MRSCQTVFQSACAFSVLQQFARVSVAPHTQKCFILSVSKKKKSYFSHSRPSRFGVAFYILNLHFSIGYYVEHLFHMHICHTCIFKEVSVLSSSFLNCVFVCLFIADFFQRVLYIYIYIPSCQISNSKILSSSLQLVS